MDNMHLVRQCQSGDREALGILYRIYYPRMRKIVSYYVSDNDAVCDILHDGFLIAFTSMGSLHDRSKIESWLTAIMKNLSLQYLNRKIESAPFPIDDTSLVSNVVDDNSAVRELTWNELDEIINRLPEGYGRVFRLAVLDGLSHKEIGALLGIAPHSSSSQLSHAKAMLRRMITQYRLEMGILSIVGIILLLWHGMFSHKDEFQTTPATSRNTDEGISIIPDLIGDVATKDSITPASKIIYRAMPKPRIQDNMAGISIVKDSIHGVANDSVVNDTIRIIPNIINRGESIAQEDSTPSLHMQSAKPDWSLSLAYTGSPEQNDLNRYRIPNPALPDEEGPAGEIEVTEKTRHYMPLVIGMSVNKSLTLRWSVETGLRYTLLRSDFLSESKLMNKKTIQRIHYIGVPLKLNYRIFTYNGFSLYGQGGGALDIPVNGRQSILEYSPQWGNPAIGTISIQAPLQWSVEGGLGIQYRYTPSFSIYAEPSLRYYFNSGSDIKTIRQDKPVEFTIPIGVRLTW